MRIYALVTNFQPLKVYLYRRGFARFSAARYSASFNSTDIANSVMHLTNVAIQKHGENYNSETGGKWDLRQLKLHLISRHGIATVDKMFYDIQMMIIHSLLAVQPVMMNDKHCFELVASVRSHDLQNQKTCNNASRNRTNNSCQLQKGHA